MLRLKLLFFKVLFYPRYKYYVWLKHMCTYFDWEKLPNVFQLYMDLVEPIVTYRCAKFHLEYDGWKYTAGRMVL